MPWHVHETSSSFLALQAEQREVILGLIQQLEAHGGSTDGITGELERVAGDWRLLFSTISITVGSTEAGLQRLSRRSVVPVCHMLIVILKCLLDVCTPAERSSR